MINMENKYKIRMLCSLVFFGLFFYTPNFANFSQEVHDISRLTYLVLGICYFFNSLEGIKK